MDEAACRVRLAELKHATKKAKMSLEIKWSAMTDEEKRFIVEGNGNGSEGVHGSSGGSSTRVQASTSAYS